MVKTNQYHMAPSQSRARGADAQDFNQESAGEGLDTELQRIPPVEGVGSA